MNDFADRLQRNLRVFPTLSQPVPVAGVADAAVDEVAVDIVATVQYCLACPRTDCVLRCRRVSCPCACAGRPSCRVV